MLISVDNMKSIVGRLLAVAAYPVELVGGSSPFLKELCSSGQLQQAILSLSL